MILQITCNASSDLMIKGDGKAIIRGNEGVFIMGKTVEFRMGGDIELKAVSLYFCFSVEIKWSDTRVLNESRVTSTVLILACLWSYHFSKQLIEFFKCVVTMSYTGEQHCSEWLGDV